jgi:hypothetical protein
MVPLSRAFLCLFAALTITTNVDAQTMKTRFLGSLPASAIVKVPMMKGGRKGKGGTKGLRGTTSLASIIPIKRKGFGNPSPNVTALLHRSVAPKRLGGEKKKELKVHSSTIRSISKGRLGGSSSSCGGGTEKNCTAQVSLSFDADSNSNFDNAMILYDSATYDSETESFTEEPIWYYGFGDFANGREYNFDECLEENVCYIFVFAGEFWLTSYLSRTI